MVYQKEKKRIKSKNKGERDVLDVPTKNRILNAEGVVRERVKVYLRYRWPRHFPVEATGASFA
jgi:hypothetical protein